MIRTTKTYTFIRSMLSDSRIPVGLSDLYAQVKRRYPQTAFSTVYRIVTNLEQEGKVTKSDWRDRGSKYEWSERKHHHHIICDGCGHMQDITDNSAGFQPEKISKETGFILRSHSIELSGLCPGCRKK